MEDQGGPLTREDVERLLAALDEIERYAWAARSVLLKAAPTAKGPGGAPCGLDYAIEKGGAACGREFANRVGGAQCVKLAQPQLDAAAAEEGKR
jgi:hypothetical protein